MKPVSDEELIATLREVEVPEPSPLFWEHLSQRVHDAVSAEPPAAPSWIRRFNIVWAGGAVAAFAIAALAVTVSLHRHTASPTPASTVASAAATDGDAAVLPTIQDDASWVVMGELASEMDFDEAGAAGLTVTPGTVDGMLNQLSGDEQRAAVELLQQAIKDSRSL